MSNLAATALLLLASSVPVDVGRFDPKAFPDLINLERTLPHGNMTQRVEKIMADGRCRIPGQSKRRFDITVPYAILMEKGGQAKRVVVGEVGCAPIELLVGQVVVAQADRGDFKVQHAEGQRWYTSELNFALGEQTTALVSGEENKMICKRSDPQLGTRLKFVKMCKTAADWKAYNNDRAQLRREISNAGACSGHPSCRND